MLIIFVVERSTTHAMYIEITGWKVIIIFFLLLRTELVECQAFLLPSRPQGQATARRRRRWAYDTTTRPSVHPLGWRYLNVHFGHSPVVTPGPAPLVLTVRGCSKPWFLLVSVFFCRKKEKKGKKPSFCPSSKQKSSSFDTFDVSKKLVFFSFDIKKTKRCTFDCLIQNSSLILS